MDYDYKSNIRIERENNTLQIRLVCLILLIAAGLGIYLITRKAQYEAHTGKVENLQTMPLAGN